MSQRRLFSPDIVESDAFLDMPMSSQALYFHLGMHADDDGFVSPKMIMRILGASTDDLKILLAKRFLLEFENGVVVIKHWLIHNTIRRDRYKETRYLEEKNSLFIKENGSYSDSATKWQPSGNHSVPQVKLSKDNNTVESASASSTGKLKLNKEIHPMSGLEELTYVSDEKPKRKSKHGSKTMAVLAYAYAKASGADLTKTINGSAWLKPLSEIYEYFEKDTDAAVDYINQSVAFYENITLKDGSKCNYSIRTIQNVHDVLRLMNEAPKVNKSDTFF